MKIIFNLFLTLITFVCPSCANRLPLHPTEKAMNQISNNAADNVEKLIPSLTAIALGGSMSGDVVNSKKIVFNHSGKLDIEQSIRLIAQVVDIYMKNLRSHKKIQSYLEQHTFNYKNLEIIFIVYEENGDNIKFPDIVFVDLDEGTITFETEYTNEKGFSIIEILKKEPFKEAAIRLGVWQDVWEA